MYASEKDLNHTDMDIRLNIDRCIHIDIDVIRDYCKLAIRTIICRESAVLVGAQHVL